MTDFDFGDVLKYSNMAFTFFAFSYFIGWMFDVFASREAVKFARHELEVMSSNGLDEHTSEKILKALEAELLRPKAGERLTVSAIDDVRLHLISAYVARPEISLKRAHFTNIFREADPNILRSIFEIQPSDLSAKVRRVLSVNGGWRLSKKVNERYLQNFEELKLLARSS